MAVQHQLNVLGPPQLVRDGRTPVHFRTKKHLAVLLYLHFEGRAGAIPRDRLVDLLWPNVSPDKGRRSLSQALFAIRSHLGSDAVTGKEREGVQLLVELPSDLAALGHGHLATPRVGEPLQRLEDCGGAEFSHWVDGVRAGLRGQARDTLRASLQAARANGNTSATNRLAAALYDIDPLCAEAVHALAERALLDGDTVAAVRLLKAQVQRADAELGTNPNPEIVRLLRRLERGERPAFPPLTSRRADPLDRAPPFVGRDAELGRLEALANRVVDGTPPGYQTCLISGEPGIGKSALLRRFATSLQARAWPLFMVSCQEIGHGIPYAAVSELMTALGRDPAAGGTAPVWLSEASRVCPGLRAIYPGVPEAPVAPTDSIRLRVAEALLHMIEAVADNGPVLLAFDDLQFIDPASEDVLYLVTRGLGGGRVSALLLAGRRVREPGAGELIWRDTIELLPLDRSQALSLVRNLAADAPEANAAIQDAIVRLSQGNPYHIEMLLADWRAHHADSLVAAANSGDAIALSWTPPEDLRAAFARQYSGLSTDAQHVLHVLAVAGKSMAPQGILTLLGLDGVGTGGVSERVVVEILDRGIGRVEQGRLAFKNELHRAYVYYAMGNDRRTYHHSQLAQRLAGSQDRHQLHGMLELVHHCICSGLEQQAMDTALEAAEFAIAHAAPREAERVLTRILKAYAVAPGSRLRLLLAHALFATGDYRRALDTLESWEPPLDAAAATDRALAAYIRADALGRTRLGGGAAILRAAEEAVALAKQADATTILVRANYLRLEVAMEDGSDAARADAESVAAAIASSDATPECVALANLTLGLGALMRGDPAESIERCNVAAPVLRSLTLSPELRRVLDILGIGYRSVGRFGDATSAFREAVDASDRCGHVTAALQSRLTLGSTYHDLACFDAAVDCYRVVWAALDTVTMPRAWAEAYFHMVGLALVLGSRSEAEIAAERCEDGARRSGHWRHRVAALVARAQVYVATGRPELAWPLVEEAVQVTGDRTQSSVYIGSYERLQRQFCWATRGYEATKLLRQRAPIVQWDSLVVALEVRLFHEAVAHIAGDCAGAVAPVLEEAVATGLLGPLARLMAGGIHHPAVPPRLEGESAAQLIARVFPHVQRTKIPTSIASG